MRATAERVRGRGIGIVVGSAIAGGWAIYAARVLAPGSVATPIGAVTVAACLIAGGISVIRGSRRLAAPDAGQHAASKRSWRLFWLNFVGEIVVLNLAVWLLGRLGGLGYLVPIISIVVGLHFLPMARFFNNPAFTWTAALMIAVALVVIMALHAAPDSRAVGLEAAANALILWGTAATGWLAMRRTLAEPEIFSR
ncbi:hypothetical protein KX816_07665 [Sphingosinicellaceae bacterium]|nr:hypothetical protein KX816_07665 [Sphingosinicellaceae bacterium]